MTTDRDPVLLANIADMQCPDEANHVGHGWWALDGQPYFCQGFVGRAGVPVVPTPAEPRVVVCANDQTPHRRTEHCREPREPEGGDDLDAFLAEQLRDPAFAEAWMRCGIRDWRAAYERGKAEVLTHADVIVPCRDTREDLDGALCTGEFRYGPRDIQAKCTVCGGWRGRYVPAELTTFEHGKAEGIAEERRERILSAMVRDAPEGVQCRIDGGPWAEFAFTAGRHPDDRAGLFGRSPEWSGNAALAAISSDQRLGPVKVEVSLWGVHLVGEAELMELSFGWPGNDGARLIGRSPLRHPDAPTGGSDAA